MADILQVFFIETYFPECKISNFKIVFVEIYSLWYNLQCVNTVSDNGLVPTRRQVIVWSNDDPVHWRIYASPGINELTHFKLDPDSVAV